MITITGATLEECVKQLGCKPKYYPFSISINRDPHQFYGNSLNYTLILNKHEGSEYKVFESIEEVFQEIRNQLLVEEKLKGKL
jgi:hypothetical protein